jgi:CheY-like chemotaxis protein
MEARTPGPCNTQVSSLPSPCRRLAPVISLDLTPMLNRLLSPPPPSHAAYVRTAIVIDDERGMRYVVARWLESAGYQVRSATDGAEGLGLIEEQDSVDVVITDVVMPEINGHDVYSVLAQHRPEIPVIGISAVPQLESEPVGSASPMSILKMPFSGEQLLEKIRETESRMREMSSTELARPGSQEAEHPTNLVAAARKLVDERERAQSKLAATPYRCPSCGEDSVAEIRYGSSALVLRDFAAGRVILGGVREPLGAPRWQCRACGHRWRPETEVMGGS